ncbi:MAG: aquaporin [Methanomassiliicoccaceae archaeon]|nr:aquaporin [Methanomassiliicoccaceae archaeon]
MSDNSYISPRSLAAEFIGTMGLITAAIGSIILTTMVWGVPADSPHIFVLINAIAVAFILFALIETFGPLSGAHFNPAVTVAFTVSGECAPKKAVCYIAAQLSGALFGVLLLGIFFFDHLSGLFVVSEIDRSGISLILSEFFCAFMLVAIIFGCVRGGSNKTSIAVGLFVGGMILATASTMFANPAVSIARIFTETACGIAPVSAVYFIIANVAGAVAAAVLFGWLYPKKPKT